MILPFILSVCLQAQPAFESATFIAVTDYKGGECKIRLDGSTYNRYMIVKDFGFTEIYRWNGEAGILLNLWPGDKIQVKFLDDDYVSSAFIIKMGCKSPVENSDFVRIEEAWVLTHLKPKIKSIRPDYKIRLTSLNSPDYMERERGTRMILGMPSEAALRLLVHGQYFYPKNAEIQDRIAKLFDQFNLRQSVVTWLREMKQTFLIDWKNKSLNDH